MSRVWLQVDSFVARPDGWSHWYIVVVAQLPLNFVPTRSPHQDPTSRHSHTSLSMIEEMLLTGSLAAFERDVKTRMRKKKMIDIDARMLRLGTQL